VGGPSKAKWIACDCECKEQQEQGMSLHSNIITGENMTQDEIIEMAKQATIGGDEIAVFTLPELMKFAKLVAQHEREACAKLCESHWEKDGAALWCAKAIRARGKHD